MAVAFRAVGTAGRATTGTSLTATYPTNAVGDLLIMVISSSAAVTTPTGWQAISTQTTPAGAQQRIYTKRVTAVLSGTFVVTVTSGTHEVVIASYSGCALAMVRTGPSTSAFTVAAATATVANGTRTSGAYMVGVLSTVAAVTSPSFTDSAGAWTDTVRVNTATAVSVIIADGPVTGSAPGAPVATTVTATWTTSTTGVLSQLSLLTDAEVARGATGYDDFDTDTPGSTLPSPFAKYGSGTGTLAITADTSLFGTGAYLLLTTAAAANSAIAFQYGSTAYADSDVYALVHQSGTAGATATNAWVCGTAGGAQMPDSCYYLQLGWNATTASSTVKLFERTGGVDTQVGSTVTGGLVFGAAYMFRLELSGTTLRAKVWAGSGPQPIAWTVSGTVTATGKTGFAGVQYNNQAVTTASPIKLDLFSIDGAPPATAYAGGQFLPFF